MTPSAHGSPDIPGKVRPEASIRPVAGWQETEREGSKVWWVSHGQEVDGLVSLVVADGAPVDGIRDRLAAMDGHFACVVSAAGHFLAAVDRNRSIPLFYRVSRSTLRVSNSARELAAGDEPAVLDPEAVLEMRMAGYVTGRRTAVEGLYQLLPGEFLLWRSGEPRIRIERYYRYVPSPDPIADRESLAEELASLIEVVFEWTIEAAGGRPIRVPLSGGLDSRLVLCKLHELGYPDLRAYSYGVPGNHEARVARVVARRLGVPWEFVPVTAEMCRDFFWSADRREYWRMADGLSSIPSLQDVASLKSRSEGKNTPADAVFITGQSGDYITGGHIPETLLEPGTDDCDVVAAIIAKHFSLRRDLKIPENLASVRALLEDQLNGIRRIMPVDPAGLYEAWEWQERQSKYVVNQVRMYDYAGFSWLMPLWHGRFMRFWEGVPYELKIRQQLFKMYLKEWDYRGLFTGVPTARWKWPGMTIVALPIAAAVGILFGANAKKWFYRRARYFGQYGFMYGIYGFRSFLSCTNDIRNPVSLMAETWAEELPEMVDSWGGRE